MEGSGNLSVGDWNDVRPDDDGNLLIYSKYYFPRDGSCFFKLLWPDHTVIETIEFAREDSIRRPIRK